LKNINIHPGNNFHPHITRIRCQSVKELTIEGMFE
jgi:hypothetical protein